VSDSFSYSARDFSSSSSPLHPLVPQIDLV
jgi:hypothetical protein